MSAPRAPRTVTHAPAAKPASVPPRASRRSAVPAGVDAEGTSPWASSALPFGGNGAAAPAWASSPAAPFGMARPAGIQLKPVIGAADDPYEREADRVADHVVSGPAADTPRITPVTPFALRPAAAPDAGPERRRSDGAGAVQRATAGDRSERGDEERSRSSIPAARVHQSGTDDERKDETVVQRATAGDRTAHDDPEHPSVAQRKARAGWRDGDADMRDSAAQAIARRGPGTPLMPGVRELLESRMGVDLGHVRVHTGTGAERATAALGARAFTHRGDIWLGRGESAADTRLVAHEATHVVQQGAAAAQAPATAEARVQRFIPDSVLERLNDYARHIPGWTLFTVIIGYNPLTRRNVERTATSLLGGIMGLVPFGTAIFDKLNEHGIVGDAFNWVRGELGRLDLSLGRLERTIEAAWAEVHILTSSFSENMAVLRRHFGALYDDVVSFAGSLVNHVLQMIKDAVVGVAERLLGQNRAWSLIKKILRRDPLRDVPVQATNVEILEDFLLLIGQEQHLRQMRERGKVEEAANWIATQIATFMGLLGELRGLVTRAWDAIQPSNLHNLMDNVRALATDAGGFLQRVWDFASTVAARVLEFIKQALLGWLASFANDVPGFHLLTVILGRNPFTGEAVPRTAVNLIRGFITLLPGGAAIYARLQETGTIARAAGRIEGAVEALGISWAFITGIFRGIWDTLGIGALAEPVATFTRIVGQFAEPVSRLFRFVGVVLREIISIVLEIMNFPSDLIGSIIANAMAAIEDIKRDPVGFLLNMLAAVKRGFSSFFEHIVTHLTAGLADWLFRGLRQAGIQPPRDFSLRSVLGFVMEVLGISVERIWQKLGERLGAERVARVRGAIDRLTGIWTFVRDVQQRGVVAIWEYIQTRITGLWDMVLQKARDWIMERIVNRAIQWLMSLLDITGIMPVINSFAAFFRAVQSAIDYLRDILAIVNDYVMTLAAVARGEIAPGAQKIERGLANAIPVAIGFLANQFGLSNIGEKIQEIVGGLREMVDGALNWLIDRAVSSVQALLASLGLGGRRAAAGRERGDLGRTITFTAEGEQHRLWIERRGSRAVVMMNSERDEAANHVDNLARAAESLPSAASAAVAPEVQQARAAVQTVERSATQAAAAGATAGGPAAATTVPGPGAQRPENLVPLEQAAATQITEVFASLAAERFAKFRSESPHKAQDLEEENRKFAPASDPTQVYARSSPAAFERPAYVQFMSTQSKRLRVEIRTASRDLRAAVRAGKLSYVNVPSGPRYAIVEPTHTPVVVDITERAASQDLVAAVRALGILPFMRQMALNQRVAFGGKTMTLRGRGPLSLEHLWRSSANRAYLASQFRAPNRHEWLPSDMVYAVIDSIASAPEADRGVLAARLIDLHNSLRTNTAWVIFKWSKASATERIGGTEFKIIQGHAGALYRRPDQTGPATIGEPVFHTQLRGAFGANKTVAQVATGLQDVFRNWVWDGSAALPQPLHPDEIHRIHGAISNPQKLAGLRNDQQREYAAADASFERFK